MRRQLIVNGVIAALALGSLGVVWATRDAPTSSELNARKNKLFATWDRDAVTQLLLRRGGVAMELLRDASSGVEGDFRITQPWQERADIAAVSTLLGSLELASQLRAADGVGRAQAGLNEPSLEITVKMASGAQTLRLGGAAPAPAGARYVELNGAGGARVVIVSAGVASELDMPLDKLRDPRLLELGRSDLAKLTLEQASGKVELLQQKPGTFYLQRASALELAGREASERILTALSRLVTSQFVAPAQARSEIAKDSAAQRVLLEPSDKAKPKLTLSFGGACPGRDEQSLVLREEAGRAPRAGCMAKDIVQALRASEAELVLDAPFAARVDEVAQLEISATPFGEKIKMRSPGFLDLVRKGNGFQLRSPAETEVALDAGNQRISAILRAPAQRSTPSELGPETGWVRVELIAGSGPTRPSELLRLGTPRGDGSLCLKREADAVVLCVDADAAKAFRTDATLLRSLAMLRFAASDLKQLDVETADLAQRLERSEDGSYSLKKPQGLAHDGGLVTDAVQSLGALTAERWVATAPAAVHGFDSPRLRARIELGSGAVHELIVGARTKDGFYARLAADAGVFVLARSTVAALQGPFIDRSLFPRLGAELASVMLTRGAHQVTLSKAGEAWSGTATPARAGELVETLAALRADFAVHLGPAKPSEGLSRPALSVTFVAKDGKRDVLRIGARDTIEGAAIAYARLDSVDATFAVASSTVNALQSF
jgi:hypothetical protein